MSFSSCFPVFLRFLKVIANDAGDCQLYVVFNRFSFVPKRNMSQEIAAFADAEGPYVATDWDATMAREPNQVP